MADPITFVIDISHHQDKALNLALTRRDGCELCLMKAGEGASFVDEDFASNLAESRAAGQLVGAYWYQRGNVSAAAHVAKIKQVVPRDVPVILDVEANSGGIALTREIIRLLNVEGYRTPLVYIPRWYWQQIGSPSLVGLPPLWSSRYPNNRVGTLASEWAEVPAHYWDGYGGLPVALLQFTSSARIAGYQPLDASAFRGTRTQLAALLGGQTPEENDVFTPDDFNALMWGNTFDDNGKGYKRNFAAYIKDIGGQVNGLTVALQAQTKLIVDSEANDITPENLAVALEGLLVAKLGPVVRQEVADALDDDNAEQADVIADRVLAKVADKLRADAA